jgi:aspartate carbamoyltransferase
MPSLVKGTSTLRHILSVDQFSRREIETIFHRANEFAPLVDARQPIELAKGYQIANLFYEPSTRTSSSFHAAITKLGGREPIQINGVHYSSVAKGETLEDTIRTMQCYTDAIVLRHSEEGAAYRAAMVAEVPIINAGDGIGEHPTQALLDLYTIEKELGTLNGVHVILMGDLLHGRTIKSLAKLLRKYLVRITWVSPPALRVPGCFVADGEIETDDLSSVIDRADVLYITRTQHERHTTDGTGLDLKYQVTRAHLDLAKTNMVLMHPLPRNNELPVDLDSDPRSAYFRQMRNGLFVRMAILASVLDL